MLSEGGRGLYLVSALAEDFHVSRRRSKGSHACAVLYSTVALRARNSIGSPDLLQHSPDPAYLK
jgi:hypothetical protein